MVLVRETVLADWPALRDIRLEALRDHPAAFASSYAGEAARDEAYWRGRRAGGGLFLAPPRPPRPLPRRPAPRRAAPIFRPPPGPGPGRRRGADRRRHRLGRRAPGH